MPRSSSALVKGGDIPGALSYLVCIWISIWKTICHKKTWSGTGAERSGLVLITWKGSPGADPTKDLQWDVVGLSWTPLLLQDYQHAFSHILYPEDPQFSRCEMRIEDLLLLLAQASPMSFNIKYSGGIYSYWMSGSTQWSPQSPAVPLAIQINYSDKYVSQGTSFPESMELRADPLGKFTLSCLAFKLILWAGYTFIMFNLCLILFMGSLWMKGTLWGKSGYVKTAYNKS